MIDKFNTVLFVLSIFFLPGADFVGGVFEDLSASAKNINLSSRDKLSALVKHW